MFLLWALSIMKLLSFSLRKTQLEMMVQISLSHLESSLMWQILVSSKLGSLFSTYFTTESFSASKGSNLIATLTAFLLSFVLRIELS